MSNRLTFSLASLVLLFGLIFIASSVMAALPDSVEVSASRTADDQNWTLKLVVSNELSISDHGIMTASAMIKYKETNANELATSFTYDATKPTEYTADIAGDDQDQIVKVINYEAFEIPDTGTTWAGKTVKVIKFTDITAEGGKTKVRNPGGTADFTVNFEFDKNGGKPDPLLNSNISAVSTPSGRDPSITYMTAPDDFTWQVIFGFNASAATGDVIKIMQAAGANAIRADYSGAPDVTKAPSIEITLDESAPAVTVTHDSLPAGKTKFDANFNVYIEVDETVAKSALTVTASPTGKVTIGDPFILVPRPGGGKTFRVTISAGSAAYDGDITVTVKAADSLGNEGSGVSSAIPVNFGGGGTTPTPGAPTKPTAAPTVPATPTGLAIALNWTAHTDTVTGYEVKVYKGDTAAAATASTTAIATVPVAGATTTTYTYTAAAADRGKYFAFTVAGVNAQGTGAHSDKGTPVMVPTSSTGVPPAVMDAPTAVSNDRAITVSWTAHPDATVTGYQLQTYKGDTAAAATASTTPLPFIAGPGGSNVVRKASAPTTATITVPEADRGKYFAFTIRARNDTGFGPYSPKSTPVEANNDPAFDDGATIADIDIWKGQDYTSAALPMASDDVGDTVTHTFDPALPTGFAHVEQSNTSYIKVTGTATAPDTVAALKDKAFKYVATDSAGAKAELSFKITLKAPIAPTASPSDDTATFMVGEKGIADWRNKVGWVDGFVLRNSQWVAGKVPAPRTVNTNEVVLDWEAPSADPMADYGAKIDRYWVYWERTSAPKDKGRYDAVSGDKTEFTTPPLQNGTYHFDVTAENSAGESKLEEPSHNPVVVCSAPGVPRDLRAAVDQNANMITLDWNIPLDDGGCAIETYVIYMTDENNNSELRWHQNTTTHFLWPEALSPGQYVFRVAAENADDVSDKSQGTQFTTIVSVDQPPVFEVTNIDDITIMGGATLSKKITLPKATDPEGESVTYSISPALPSNLTFTATDRSISGTALNVDADATTHHTYTATAGAKSATLTFSVTVTRLKPATIEIPTATSSSEPIPLAPQFNPSIPAYGFAVLVRDVEGSGTYAPLPNTWKRSIDTPLPDLAWFFGTQPDARGGRTNGGTIALNGPGAKKDLVISEVMWGTDSSLAVPARSQWIEFYNATPNPINLAGYAITFHRSQVHPSEWANAIDFVSNVSGHSVYFAPSELPGQSGRSNVVDSQGRYEQQRDLVSMYRQIDHVGVKHYNTGNRGERDKRITGWAASVYPTANIRPVHIATPGAEQISRVTIAKTTFSQDIIISEIGNSGNDDYDWIELHNTTSEAIKLRKWDLTMIVKEGNVGKEKRIFQFPDNDTVWVPANGYLVIARTHPRNDGNDLAAGIDVTKSAIDQLKRGLGEKDLKNHPTAYYYVNSGLVLPNGNERRLYVLRNANDKHGQPSHVVDATGTLSIEVRGDLPSGFTGYAAQAMQLWNTATWPFQGAGKRHDNTIDGTGDEDFRAGRVYQRQGKNSGMGEKHLAIRGYTGVGYDRHAAVNAENGGTPGYSKDAVKGDKSNWANQVTISEIMLVTEEGEGAGRVPRATRLPQWFEIYNASLTEAVSINNWYLEIQNDDTPGFLTNLHGTLRLPNVIIQPNQTVLVVSNSGLNSGNFPDQRTINVFTNSTYRQILGLSRRGEPMLNPEGFYIELRDHKNNSVDEIGNLGVSRRTGIGRADNFGEAWEMPVMHSEEGHRTSLIRIYDKGIPRSGLNGVGGPKDASTSWTLASNTNFRQVPSLSYYGNHRDFGTPGYRGGGPLPVSLSKFRPERLESGEVVIRWVTESELNNAGFNILRSDTRSGEFTKVNTKLIAGYGTTSERNTYEWKDTSAKPNVVYYYQIQDVSIDGQTQTLRVSRLKGNVSPAGKATTTWGELKALQ